MGLKINWSNCNRNYR